MSDIVLFDFWRSSAAYRVRIALGLLGLSWRREVVDLDSMAQKDPAYLARHPQGLVPTLEIDGLVLTQTLAIMEYLEETRGAGFLPADPAGRARVRAMAYAVAMEIHPICNITVARHVEAASEGRVSVTDWMARFIPMGFAGLERMLESPATGPYCHGDRVTLADICLVPQVYNAVDRWGLDMTPFPRISAIAARLREIPAFAAAHPDRFRPGVG